MRYCSLPQNWNEVESYSTPSILESCRIGQHSEAVTVWMKK